MTVVSLWQMAHFNADMPRPSRSSSAGVIQGFGLGLVFVPVSTIAYATLPTQYAHRSGRHVQSDAQYRLEHRHFAGR